MGSGERVFERSMRGIARQAVGGVIEALEQNNLVRLHVRKIKPFLSHAVPDLKYFTLSVLINQIRRHEVIRPNGPGIGHGERQALRRYADGAPYVDHGEAMAEVTLGLGFRHYVSDPLGS